MQSKPIKIDVNSDNFDDIKRLYGDSFHQHGDSPKSLLTPKGRNYLRFRAIDPYLTGDRVSILDYGCGLGYLRAYLKDKNAHVAYTGMDILEEFVEACREKHPNDEFKLISPGEQLSGRYDVVFSSGVFNLQTHQSPEQSKSYAFDRLKNLFELTEQVFICDFMSSYVDFRQDGAQHFSPAELADFCHEQFGRRFQIRHDLLPYELTLIIWRDQTIKSPENVYGIDQ